jgi:CHAT domain-containing protein/Tfp pilus assembly protein PilF
MTKKFTISILVLSFLLTSCSTLKLYFGVTSGAKKLEEGDLEKAAKKFEKTLPAIVKLYGEEDTLILTKMLISVAGCYGEIMEYKKAETYAQQALDIYESKNAIDDEYYGTGQYFLARAYMLKGDYSKAMEHYQIAEELYIKKYGENDTNVANVLGDMAITYQFLGDYANAEKNYQKAKVIFRESLGEESMNYADVLNNIGVFYQEMGNYEEAVPTLLKAIELKEKVYGKESQYVANSINNLGIVYLEMEEYEKAKEQNEICLEIRKKTLGTKHQHYGISLNNQAMVFQKMGEYEQSIEYSKKAIKIILDNYGKDFPEYSRLLIVLGDTYFARKDYEKALECQQESKKIIENTLGKTHPRYALSLFRLAKTYQAKDENKKALKLYIEALDVSNQNIWDNFAFMSEKEKELYFVTRRDDIYNFYAFALDQKEENPDIGAGVYNNIIKHKGVLLRSSTAMRTAILNSKNESLIEKYNDWVLLKRTISDLYAKSANERKENPEKLEKEANKLEKELVQESKMFSSYRSANNLDWTAVKGSLKDKEAAVEFLSFEKDDEIIYCGLVIKPESKYPQMILLFTEKQINEVIGVSVANDYDYISNIYGTKDKPNTALYELIWKPLEPALEGVQKVYYSPDGILHKISIPALAKDQDAYLCDLYQLRQVSNTVNILSENNFVAGEKMKALLFGGIDYNAGDASTEVWKYLPGTKKEAESIQEILAKNKIEVKEYFSDEAMETKLKNAFDTKDKKPDILHIATHGFFYPEPGKVVHQEVKKEKNEAIAFRGSGNLGYWQFVKNKNPMMRSGLVFAGANQIWSENYEYEGEDGVLTAEEVSQLDMSQTQLAVLSACETGLGDIEGNEGVYGLQRAFKMAGVDFVIMSLWQVPDKETMEFMSIFYQKLFELKDVEEAFYKTQKQMREKYGAYFWGAFVLVN